MNGDDFVPELPSVTVASAPDAAGIGRTVTVTVASEVDCTPPTSVTLRLAVKVCGELWDVVYRWASAVGSPPVPVATVLPSPKSIRHESIALSGSVLVEASNVTSTGVVPEFADTASRGTGGWLTLTVIFTVAKLVAPSSSVTVNFA